MTAITEQEYRNAMGRLENEGAIWPYNHRPGTRTGNRNPVFFTTEDAWNGYQYNPPQYRTDIYPDPDPDASPKPTWAEIVAAARAYDTDRVRQNSHVLLTRETANRRQQAVGLIAGASSVDGAALSAMLKLAATGSEEDRERLETIHACHDFLTHREAEIRHWLATATLEQMEATDNLTAEHLWSDAWWTPPGASEPFADHAMVTLPDEPPVLPPPVALALELADSAITITPAGAVTLAVEIAVIASGPALLRLTTDDETAVLSAPSVTFDRPGRIAVTVTREYETLAAALAAPPVTLHVAGHIHGQPRDEALELPGVAGAFTMTLAFVREDPQGTYHFDLTTNAAADVEVSLTGVNVAPGMTMPLMVPAPGGTHGFSFTTVEPREGRATVTATAAPFGQTVIVALNFDL